jgi:SAM-dependent methyltransferase
LGVGAGKEPLAYFLASQVGHVFASDHYGFGWPSAPFEMLLNPDQFAPYKYPRIKLTALQMDGCKLLFPESSLDFIYSVSSIEHFGGYGAALTHLEECRRVLKPGGLVVFTTEFWLAGGRSRIGVSLKRR